MNTDNLPEPMVPAEVDLRGLEYMPLLGAKLFESDFNLEASDAEFRRALLLWWKAWNQQPAASLPNNERAQAKLAGFEDEKSPGWKKVRDKVLHGFELCSDGRLYHPVLARQALIAWERRAEEKAERENTNDRKRRERADRRKMFAELRTAGIVPPYNITMPELRALAAQLAAGEKPTVGQAVVTKPVTVTDTAKTGRDGTGLNTRAKARATSEADARAPDDDGSDDLGDGRPVPPLEPLEAEAAPMPPAEPPPPAPVPPKAAFVPLPPAAVPKNASPVPLSPPPLPPAPPPRGLAAAPSAPVQPFVPRPEAVLGQALKRGGLDPSRFNTSDPRLTAMVVLGVTPDMLEEVTKEGVRKGKQLGWIVATVEGRIQDAKQITQQAGGKPASTTTRGRHSATERRAAAIGAFTGQDRTDETRFHDPDDTIDVDARRVG